MSTNRVKVEETMSSLPVAADDEEFIVDTRDLSPAHILTEIKSFSRLSDHGISEIESEFEAGGRKWKLIIYPNGDDNTKEAGHISAHLSIVGTASLPTSWEVNAIVNLFIYNHLSHDYHSFRAKKPHRFHAINTKWKISKLMDRKRFIDPSSGYLFNDNCVFGAEVFVAKNDRLIKNTVYVLAPRDPYKREWEIPYFSRQLTVWNSEEFSSRGLKWRIKLHPNGNTGVEGRYISIYLHCVDSNSFAANKKVKATCLFIVKNLLNGEKSHSKKATQWYTSSVTSWGYPSFMEIGEAMKDYIVEDTFLLEIQLSVEAIQEPLKLE